VNDRSLARALSGPILLITLGVLFALDNSLQLPFSRTWPVILIILGLFGLIRHWAERANGGRPNGSGPSSGAAGSLDLARPQGPKAQAGSGAVVHEPPSPGDTL
jgi:hypothetical protein